ncbi:alpha-amylase family glycosyl hydrolase [Truepera radiovictrix]|uniref:Alpha amylase catalytic region n=1 Tax=Truepera radiovictrix (strain DSM 17093 / CIP 108686 / LMG 22925 / RQ-24) TaxID=649638 RepID=D7CXF0_TRURR|nr:alpha-amylase family glycosyl hydrolase [Truepera radiovictrix]ADI13274.1 alpha amylase catalytic region [Truepera radiovictrix DSM 17093]WMT58162.1 alpha-amylase family glycosyl hydrolase [Truepera radiovictrix]
MGKLRRLVLGALLAALLGACAQQEAPQVEPARQPLGALELSVTGLPEGTPAAVTVTGPARYRQVLTRSTTLRDLQPGAYTTRAEGVSFLGVTYTPTVDPQRAVVTKGQTARVGVRYARPAPQSAELVVSVTGLPDGVASDVTVLGPEGFEVTLTESARLRDLTPGSYTVTRLSVWTGSEVFVPDAPAETVTVAAAAETVAAVTYGRPEPVARPEPTDWRREVIYFAMTDRFRNGDPTNDSGARRPGAADEVTTEAENPLGWHGGDFAGLTQAIRSGYFQEMGFTALWLTPVYLQVPAITVTDGGSPNDGKRFAGYHGYWAEDFFQVDPHLGTKEEYRELVATAQAHGIRVIQDMVVNHTGYGATLTETRPEWFHDEADCAAGDPVVACPLAGLPDFDQRRADVTAFLNATVDYWVEHFGIDGIRMDTVKHVYDDYWRQFFAPGGVGDPARVWTVGELFDGNPGFIARYLDDLGLPAAFDFPLYFRIKDHLSSPAGNLDDVAVIFDQDGAYEDPTRLVTFVDNHDVPRFMSEALSRGVSEAHARERLDAALSLIYTVRGTPSVYYGTENAATGRGDPYSYGPFEGNRVKLAPDAPAPLAPRLRALAAARAAYPALTHGAQRELWRPNGREPVMAFRRTLAGERTVVAVLNNGDAPIDLTTLSAGGIPLRGTFALSTTLTEVTGRAHNLSITDTGLLVGTVPPRTLLAVAGDPGEDEETGTTTVTLTVDARSQGEAQIELRRFDTGREERLPMTPVAGQPGFWTITLSDLERFRSLAFKFGNAAPGAKNAGYEGFGQGDRTLYLDAAEMTYEGVYNFISVPAPETAFTGTVTLDGAPATRALVEASDTPARFYAFTFADGSFYLPYSGTTDLTASKDGQSQTLSGVSAPASGLTFTLGGSGLRYAIDGDLGDWTQPRARLINPPYDGGFGPDNLFSELLVDWDATYLYLGYRYRAAGNSAIIHLDVRDGGVTSVANLNAWPRLASFANPIDAFVAQYQGDPAQLWEVRSSTQAARIDDGVITATAGSGPAYTIEVALPWRALGFASRPTATLNLHAGIYGGDGYGAGDIAPHAGSTPPASGNTVAGFDASRRVDFQTPFSVPLGD